jgi:hypothetical protein
VWFSILKNYVSIANSLLDDLKEFKPKIVGSVGKKDNPKDIDLLFPLDVNWDELNRKLNNLGWKMRYADEDEFNGELFWNYEKKIEGEFVGLDVFIGE